MLADGKRTWEVVLARGQKNRDRPLDATGAATRLRVTATYQPRLGVVQVKSATALERLAASRGGWRMSTSKLILDIIAKDNASSFVNKLGGATATPVRS